LEHAAGREKRGTETRKKKGITKEEYKKRKREWYEK
jgi:hypothetical protein